MMGVCFDCLVRIDGKANQQGCMVLVKPGMRIELQHGANALVDVLSAGRVRGTSPGNC